MAKQAAPPTPPAPENLPPHSVEAEEALLGSILISPDMLPLVSYVQPDHFFIVRNGYVWDALLKLDAASMGIDTVTVAEQLRTDDRLNEIGGPAYLTYLINHTPTSLYAEAYAQIVSRAAARRLVLRTASDMAATAYDENADIDEVMSRAHDALDGIALTLPAASTFPLETALSNYMDEVEDAANMRSVATGFSDLDDLLGGLRGLSLLAGRPGMGKTAWLLTVLLSVARRLRDAGDPGVLVLFSLEMDASEVVERLISMETDISVVTLKSGKLSDEQWSQFVNAVAELAGLNILIDERGSLTPGDILTTCKRITREHGPIRLVLVDYAQLMTVDAEQRKYVRTDVEVNAYISRNLKLLVKRIGAPVLAAAQLNREVEKRQDKRPQLSDLGRSGTYEQDTDIVLFLYRDEVYNENTERVNQAECIVAKHRHGPKGTVDLFFRAERMKFSTLKKTVIDLAGFSDTWTPYSEIPPDVGGEY
ncbi:MAG TPA: replicative DNA helicase [Aggregatilinea sp.]|uniref:replicative DNA helicase n=1 Tax=Aggregatilinea sp. TaxID=2806333 RepID=UPI002C47503E|nr:replicative DNA helicase [Aggregatilinea sp.]HML21838.1 replicative DNA helicase [Aggregatilinea sp.]